MEMDRFQHPDSIWTWKSNQRGSRASLWIPYLDEIKKIRGSRWQLTYNGGEVEVDLKKIDTIMLYGASGSIPVRFLDELGIYRVPMLVHRRNMDAPAVWLPAPRPDADDVMGKQVLSRMNAIRSSYIARCLVRARFKAVNHRLSVAPMVWQRFNRLRQVDAVRQFEARWAKRYWKQYFDELGAPDLHRRDDNPISAALNACSFFLYGIGLRWVLVHRLSPQHGFLHRPTTYPSLIYDLIEPYRYVSEQAVECAVTDLGPASDELTESALTHIRRLMETTVYVPTTRQYVRRKNLLHGSVLALRAWLLGDMPRFVIPEEGSKIGGRPVKVSYTLPGSRNPHATH